MHKYIFLSAANLKWTLLCTRPVHVPQVGNLCCR